MQEVKIEELEMTNGGVNWTHVVGGIGTGIMAGTVAGPGGMVAGAIIGGTMGALS
ncbi:hypothetical protein [Veillonella sp.]|nr:hypothetical protein [Veillonella sp.]MDU2102784.1 hypothetical protein [Veillonella sp.]